VETKRLLGDAKLPTLRKLRGKIVVLGFLGTPGQLLRQSNAEQIQFFRKLRDVQKPDVFTILTLAQADDKEGFAILDRLRTQLKADELPLHLREEWTASSPFHKSYGLVPSTLPEALFVVIDKRGRVAVAGCNSALLPAAITRARKG
jgi:hypothetical protein